MVMASGKKSDLAATISLLSEKDTRLMLVLCTDLINLCAELIGNIDPAAAAMVTYVRDEIDLENRLYR